MYILVSVIERQTHLLFFPLKERKQHVVVKSFWFFRYQGHVGSSLIVGGVDVTGAHLYSVYPHGSYDKLPFLTMGACLCVFMYLYLYIYTVYSLHIHIINIHILCTHRCI